MVTFHYGEFHYCIYDYCEAHLRIVITIHSLLSVWGDKTIKQLMITITS